MATGRRCHCYTMRFPTIRLTEVVASCRRAHCHPRQSPTGNRLIELTQHLKQHAQQAGFVLCGITASAAPGRLSEFHRWLEAGYAGQMHYLESRREAYSDPKHVLEGCRSLIMLALPYADASSRDRHKQPADQNSAGQVARYAAADIDYHDLIHAKLKQLRGWLLEQRPSALVRGIVDTAPLLEREFAEAAGLGWIGKNTLLLNRQHGSYFFLACLLTDLELRLDEAESQNYCGSCTACLSACPTDAFPSPFVLDASRCISYLTIEHRDNVDPAIAEQMGDWLFGCDICQEVCPWNRKAMASQVPEFQNNDHRQSIDLLETLALTEDGFRSRYRKTPLWRSKRRGILRNAILCAVNTQLVAAEPLCQQLLEDPEPLIREAAAWAVEKFSQLAGRHA